MRIVLEDGLEARWAKHKLNQHALIAGVEALGLKLLVENPKDRLVTVTAVMIPSGVTMQNSATSFWTNSTSKSPAALAPSRTKSGASA